MSNHLVSMVYKRDLGSVTRKAVMVLLADKASDDGSGIWASKQCMADELCLSRLSVRKVIKTFVSEGLIVEVGRRECSNGYTTEYALNVAAIEALPLVGWHATRQSPGNHVTPYPVTSLPPTRQPRYPLPGNHVTMNHDMVYSKYDIIPDHKDKNDMSSHGSDDSFSIEDFVEAWNETADLCGLRRIVKMTEARRRAFNARKREYPEIDCWRSAFATLRKAKWMHGANDRGWRADPDFFLQPKAFTRLVEGTYGKADM